MVDINQAFKTILTPSMKIETKQKYCDGCSYIGRCFACGIIKKNHYIVNHVFYCKPKTIHRLPNFSKIERKQNPVPIHESNHYCVCQCGLTKDNHNVYHPYKCSFCKILYQPTNDSFQSVNSTISEAKFCNGCSYSGPCHQCKLSKDYHTNGVGPEKRMVQHSYKCSSDITHKFS